MRAKRYALVGLVVAAAMWAGTAGAAPVTKAQVCEATKVTAAGTKQKCLATERAKEVKGQTPNYAKCDAAFTRAFTKAETMAGAGVCPTQGDAAAVEAQIDAAADRLNAALSGDTPPATHLFPATGQTTCWDPSGTTTNVIPCGGTGQDGDIRAGSALSYTDNGDGTITDTNTGLTWEKKSDDGTIHDKDTTYTWANAFAVHIAGLNASGGFAGHTDWRLPNLKELQSIVNDEKVNPPVSLKFNNTGCVASCTVLTCSCTAPSFHWSSSTIARLPAKAWGVSFFDGIVDFDDKFNPYVVRAVRGGL